MYRAVCLCMRARSYILVAHARCFSYLSWFWVTHSAGVAWHCLAASRMACRRAPPHAVLLSSVVSHLCPNTRSLEHECGTRVFVGVAYARMGSSCARHCTMSMVAAPDSRRRWTCCLVQRWQWVCTSLLPPHPSHMASNCTRVLFATKLFRVRVCLGCVCVPVASCGGCQCTAGWRLTAGRALGAPNTAWLGRCAWACELLPSLFTTSL